MNDDHIGRVVCDGNHRGTDRRHIASSRLTYAIARYRDRVLDGPRVWGTIDTSVDSRGFRRYRLILFPPGVTKVERRLLRLWRALPTWVAALWLISVICVSQTHAPWVALGMATAIYLLVGAVAFDRLAGLHTQVRTLSVVLVAGYSEPGAATAYAELKKFAAILCTADALLGQGRISATEHEFIWWQIYERVGERSNALDDRRS